MKIAECKHLPEKFVVPRTNMCEQCQGALHALGLRVCLVCGHVGCCESDPGQHALKHARENGHQVIASYPADRNSFIWCYADNDYLEPDELQNLKGNKHEKI